MDDQSSRPKNINVLICGDSFAADWQVKYPQGLGWPNLVAKSYPVKNRAQAGCSQYKILKQLQDENLYLYTHVIIAHTSPNRIPVSWHPVHHDDPLHQNSDLIYTDCKFHEQQDKKLTCIVQYFENYFDLEYAQYCYDKILQDIDSMLTGCTDRRVLHITNLISTNHRLALATGTQKNYNYLLANHKGLHNHFDDYANQLVYRDIEVFLHD